MTQPTAAQQVSAAASQLNQLYAQKENLTEQLETVQLQIKAYRNLIAGVEIGQRFAGEVIAARAADETAQQVQPA